MLGSLQGVRTWVCRPGTWRSLKLEWQAPNCSESVVVSYNIWLHTWWYFHLNVNHPNSDLYLLNGGNNVGQYQAVDLWCCSGLSVGSFWTDWALELFELRHTMMTTNLLESLVTFPWLDDLFICCNVRGQTEHAESMVWYLCNVVGCLLHTQTIYSAWLELILVIWRCVFHNEVFSG